MGTHYVIELNHLIHLVESEFRRDYEQSSVVAATVFPASRINKKSELMILDLVNTRDDFISLSHFLAKSTY